MGVEPPGQLRVLVQQRRHMRNAVGSDLFVLGGCCQKDQTGDVAWQSGGVCWKGFFKVFLERVCIGCLWLCAAGAEDRAVEGSER